jgi:hypothetical protein
MKNILMLLFFSITSLTFAQNSIRLVDLNSNYLSIDNSNGAFFETGDFTFEMWIKIDAWDTGGYAGYKAGILSYNQSNFWLAIQSQGKPQLRMGCGDLTFSYTASDWVGNWKHIALVRVGETLNWYVDGQLSASKSCSGGKFMDTNTINIGTNPGWTCSIDGWISKIRYVKGTAVYTSDFTPVFEDLENISGTELLLNVANETDAFKDSSNANHTINLHGTNANPYFAANNGPLMPAGILMSGDVSIENNSIKNVADPVYAQDAATKNYVDTNISNTYTKSEVDALIANLQQQIDEPAYTIGYHAELGGYVFMISADGKHGLVAETEDQGLETWYNAQNLISNPSNHSTVGQNFTDWRLPTRYELAQMYILKTEIESAGGDSFGTKTYWTSNQSVYSVNGLEEETAWRQNFGTGLQYNSNNVSLDSDLFVRSVREF